MLIFILIVTKMIEIIETFFRPDILLRDLEHSMDIY